MTLPNINSTINPNQIYPDRIELYGQYSSTGRFRYSDFQSSLRQFSGGTASSGVTRFDLFDQDGLIFGRVEIRRAQSSNILLAKQIIDPLSYVRACAEMQEETETPLNRLWTNYLPQVLVEADNRPIWDAANELISRAENQVFELLNLVGEQSSVGVSFELENLTVHELELCCDYGTPDPDNLVEALVPVFRRHYRNAREHVYAGSVQTRGLDGDSAMVSGFLRNHERMKAYVKTNRRLRLECQLGQRALEHYIFSSEFMINAPNGEGLMHTRSRSLSNFENNVAVLIGLLAPHVAKHFNMVLAQVEASDRRCPPVIELVANVVSRTRSLDTAVEVLQSLSRNHSIETSRYPSLLNKLTRDGILEASTWGRRRLTDPYLPAARYLIRELGWLRPFLMERAL